MLRALAFRCVFFLSFFLSVLLLGIRWSFYSIVLCALCFAIGLFLCSYCCCVVIAIDLPYFLHPSLPPALTLPPILSPVRIHYHHLLLLSSGLYPPRIHLFISVQYIILTHASPLLFPLRILGVSTALPTPISYPPHASPSSSLVRPAPPLNERTNKRTNGRTNDGHDLSRPDALSRLTP